MKTINATNIIVLLILSLFITACSRGPDEAELHSQIQTMLDTEFKQKLFKVVSFNRTGSAPSTDKTTKDERLLVYFNAQLEFQQDYNLSSWDQLSISTLSFLLGATEHGINGFQSGGNKKGDVLEVFGTTHFALRNETWQPVKVSSSQTTAAEANEKAVKVRRIIDSLDETYTINSGRKGGKEIAILENELDYAARRINRKLDKLDNVFSVASGPRSGNYYQIMQLLENHLRNNNVSTRNYETEGSIENCQLIQNQAVDVAMAQNNVAAMAYQGTGLLKEAGEMSDIRAVASLFPELVHIVVAESSGINSIADLKGKRIDIGLPNSGSRVDALNVINTLDYKLSDFTSVTEKGLRNSITALKRNELDAFFVTIEAPGNILQNLAATYPIKFIPLDNTQFQENTEQQTNYLPLSIPAYTYPNQTQTITTIGVSALLIANQNLPDQKVWNLLDAISRSIDDLAEKNIKAAFISRQTMQTGITIPLHKGAQTYFE